MPQIDSVALMAIAVIVNDIPDSGVRQVVADHFAASLAGQKEFDPKRWAAATRGRKVR